MPICSTVSTGADTVTRDEKRPATGWKWYAPHRAIVLVGIIVTLIALAGAFLGVANASQAESLTAQLSQRYLVLQGPVRDLRGSAAAFQVLAARRFNDAVPPATLVPAAETDAQDANKSFTNLQHLLAASGDTDLAPHLAARMAAFVAAQNSLGAFLAGGPETPQTAHLAAVEEAAQAKPRCNAGLPAGHDQRLVSPQRPTRPRRRPAAPGTSSCGPSSSAWPSPAPSSPSSPGTRCGWSTSRPGARPCSPTSHRGSAFEASLQTALEMSRAEHVRLRHRGRGAEPGRPRHAVRAPAGRLQQGPLPAGARQLGAGRRRRVRRHVPRRLPGSIEVAEHGVRRQHGARRLSPPAGPALLRALRPHEHRRQLHRGLPRDGGGRLAALGRRGEGRRGGRPEGIGAHGDVARLRGLPDPGQQRLSHGAHDPAEPGERSQGSPRHGHAVRRGLRRPRPLQAT